MAMTRWAHISKQVVALGRPLTLTHSLGCSKGGLRGKLKCCSRKLGLSWLHCLVSDWAGLPDASLRYDQRRVRERRPGLHRDGMRKRQSCVARQVGGLGGSSRSPNRRGSRDRLAAS